MFTEVRRRKRLGKFWFVLIHRSNLFRIHIGRGIRLRYTPDGSVYLNCLSMKGVFVRSYFLDFEHGLVYGSVVHKVSLLRSI
jgi:hypothetical protein